MSVLPLLVLDFIVTIVPSGVLSSSRKSGSHCITLGARVAGVVGVLPVDLRRGREPGANLKEGIVILPTDTGQFMGALPFPFGVKGDTGLDVGEDTIGVSGNCFDTGRSTADFGMLGDSGESSAYVPPERCEIGGLVVSSAIDMMLATPRLELRVRAVTRYRGPPGRLTGRILEGGRVEGAEGKSGPLGDSKSGRGRSPTDETDDCTVN